MALARPEGHHSKGWLPVPAPQSPRQQKPHRDVVQNAPKSRAFCAEPSCDSHALASFGELCKEDSSHVQALCTSSASHAAPLSAFYFLTLGVDKEGRGLTQHSLRAPPCCSIPERCGAGTAAPPGLVPAAGGGERLGCPQLQSQLCLGGYPAVGSPKPFLIRTSSGTTTDSTLGSATAWPLSPLFAQEPPTSPISSHCPPCIVWGRSMVGVGRRLDPTIDAPRAPGDMAGRCDGDISRSKVCPVGA